MSVTRGCDAVLDAVVVLLSSWTMTYHLCLVLGLPVPWSVAIELVLLAAVGAFWWYPRSRPSMTDEQSPVAASASVAASGSFPVPRAALVALGASVTLAGLGMALGFVWALVWIPFLGAALGSATLAAVSLRQRRDPVRLAPAGVGDRATPAGATDERRATWTALLAVGWGLALAALSSVIRRPNPDDLFYVNLSQWVAEHGTFPVRDTIFADLVYPMANWPPTASYDALVGAVAHLLDARAATIAYVVVTPLATFVAVLALWRLLRAWRVRHLAIALSAALVFLLFDGTSAYGSPGNLFLTRAWQGKVILLCVLVPLLLVHAAAYAERPSRRGAVKLFLGGAATVALSTTALFLTPLIAVAGAAPLLLRRRWRAGLTGGLAMAAYPLAGAAVTVVLGGRSADEFGMRRLYRFDPDWFGHQIFLSGLVALVGVVAVLVGALLVPNQAARVTTSVLVLATAVTLVPGVTELGYATVGLGPTLWRISWGCTVAALVGVLVSEIGARLRGRVTQLVAGAVALILLVGFGAPIWAANTASSFEAPFEWKRGPGTRGVTQWLIGATQPGDVVLAPDPVAITVAVTTTEIKTVAPRDYYMDYLREDSSFDWHARIRLVRLANGTERASAATIERSLDTLDVRAACLELGDTDGSAVLRAAGFTPALQTTTYRCLLR